MAVADREAIVVDWDEFTKILTELGPEYDLEIEKAGIKDNRLFLMVNEDRVEISPFGMCLPFDSRRKPVPMLQIRVEGKVMCIVNNPAGVLAGIAKS